MTRLIKILFFLFIIISQHSFGQSIADIRKEREKSEKEIAYLNKLFEAAKSDKSVSIEKLNILRQKIVQSKRVLASLDNEVKYLQVRISDNEKRIAELQAEKNSMLDLYSKLVYNTWKKRNKTNKLMFICSSADFNQAYSRFKYFQQIQEYSKRQLKLIEQVNDSLDLKNQDLKKLVSEKNETLNTINRKNKELESEQTKENQYITALQKREKELKKKLEAENRKRQRLADELNKLIAKQIKKSGGASSAYKLTPEQKLVSDNFEKNKGKLPWPVAQGFISERFGVKKNPLHPKVELPNKGIDITTSKGSDVRAVFQGVVSAVNNTPDFNTVVLIRHGDYYTVYCNLEEAYVKVDQKVNTKDIIGKVASDDDKGNVVIFQLCKFVGNQYPEMLNPELWLAK